MYCSNTSSASKVRNPSILQLSVLDVERGAEAFTEILRVEQVAHPEPRAAVLVAVGGAYAFLVVPMSASPCSPRKRRREADARALPSPARGDAQLIVGDVALMKLVELGAQRHGIDYHAVAHHVDRRGVENAEGMLCSEYLLPSNITVCPALLPP